MTEKFAMTAVNAIAATLIPAKFATIAEKCLQRGSDEFNSIIYRYPAEDENECECECGCECDHHENGEELNSADFDEFLDEPIELDVPDPIQIDPALAAEWERRLAESFREDARREAASDDAPKGLYAVRKRRERK